jgi:multicomponent Na+:H+ antiporter subunit B
LKWVTLVFLGSFLALFVYVSADLPDRADPQAPANEYLAPVFVELTQEEVEIPNLVSAILADFRGYDTLGETVVIFTAGLAVLLVLMRGYRRDDGTS